MRKLLRCIYKYLADLPVPDSEMYRFHIYELYHPSIDEVLLIQNEELLSLTKLLATSEIWKQPKDTMMSMSLNGSCLVIQLTEQAKA